jgi:hypothetical protein
MTIRADEKDGLNAAVAKVVITPHTARFGRVIRF